MEMHSATPVSEPSSEMQKRPQVPEDAVVTGKPWGVEYLWATVKDQPRARRTRPLHHGESSRLGRS